MSSFQPVYKQVDAALRLGVAVLFVAVLYVLNISAISLPLGSHVKLPLFLMAVYYWAIYRPTLMPAWLVFAAGILMDFLGGTPIGFNALIFVLTQWSISSQRRFFMSQSFLVVWVGFSLLFVASLFLKWLIAGIVQGQWFVLMHLWVPVAFGIGFFPLVSIMLHLTHKLLPDSLSALNLKRR